MHILYYTQQLECCKKLLLPVLTLSLLHQVMPYQPFALHTQGISTYIHLQYIFKILLYVSIIYLFPVCLIISLFIIHSLLHTTNSYTYLYYLHFSVSTLEKVMP